MSAPIGYYQVDHNSETFAIVTVSFWNAHQGLDDQGSEEEFVPSGFYPLAEAIYEHDFSTLEQAKASLEQAGFVEKQIT